MKLQQLIQSLNEGDVVKITRVGKEPNFMAVIETSRYVTIDFDPVVVKGVEDSTTPKHQEVAKAFIAGGRSAVLPDVAPLERLFAATTQAEAKAAIAEVMPEPEPASNPAPAPKFALDATPPEPPPAEPEPAKPKVDPELAAQKRADAQRIAAEKRQEIEELKARLARVQRKEEASK